MGDDVTPAPPELASLLRELLAEILELDDVDLDADFVDELDVDSLQRLELMAEVEHRLGVRLDARAWREARTLAELTVLTADELSRAAPQ